MRTVGAIVILLAAAALAADSLLAIRALSDWSRICEPEGQRLWGKSLCGPMVLVDPGTREAIANRADPDGQFRPEGTVFLGKLPEPFVPSNTAFQWSGQVWSTVLMPLPSDPFERVCLLAHESFHRIQPALGLSAPDTPCAHLDTENGRLWLRLELRALASALRSEGTVARQSAGDAMLFRLYRHRLYPGSESAEAAMEKQEGLAEYTGVSIALRATGETIARAARRVENREESTAFARSFGYATGPALGLLLDRYAAGWRVRAASAPLDGMLIAALRVRVPRNLEQTARQRAALYGYTAVFAAEQEREEAHQAMLADLKARFLDGPTLDFPSAPELMRNFNPNTLVAFPPNGTFYPTGVFSANWGRLRVESGGALLSPDNRSVRVPAPPDPAGHPLHGDGWTLDLAPGWTIQPSARRGSFELTRAGR